MLVVCPQGNRSPFSGILESASIQQICYDRGRELKGLTAVAWPCPSQPQTGVDPLGGHTRQSLVYRCSPMEVTVHRMTYHFISLHIALIRRVTRKGDLP